MNPKKKMMAIAGSTLLLIGLSVGTILFFRSYNAPNEELINPVQETNAEVVEDISVNGLDTQIKIDTPQVIKEATDVKIEDTLPPPDVKETVEADGTVVQTPNWEEQKTLKEDTDLKDPEKVPEYQYGNNSGSSSKAATSNSTAVSNTPPASTEESKTDTGTTTTTPKTPTDSTTAPKTPTTSTTGSTPKNGESKVIEGSSYTYVEGFGWVKDGGGNQETVIDVTLSGEKVGY